MEVNESVIINRVPTPLLNEISSYSLSISHNKILASEVHPLQTQGNWNLYLGFFLFCSAEEYLLHPHSSENLKYLLLTVKSFVFKCIFTAKVSEVA